VVSPQFITTSSIGLAQPLAVIHGNRILMATQDAVRAYGPL
jgi:hypothetical protein